MHFGKNIKQLREKAGLSQSEFAKLLKVAQPNIPRWENGSTSPSLTTILKIAKTLNVPLEDLLISEDEKEKLKSSNLALLKRLKNIETLSPKDQQSLFQIIDAFIKSRK